MNTYSSSEVAKIIGIHPNTVRLYEEWGLTPQAERKANGYRVFTDFHIEQLDKSKSHVNELSGGQRQKLFIVLALIPNPEVVFLDELTTGLDAKARREVWKILSKLKEKGVTILLTSHFMDEVKALCDTICILKKGISVFYGTVQEAISSSPHEKFDMHIYGIQMRR